MIRGYFWKRSCVHLLELLLFLIERAERWHIEVNNSEKVTAQLDATRTGSVFRFLNLFCGRELWRT